jgi:hypothetical protein
VDLLPSPTPVGADRWSALKLAKPSTHRVDLLPSCFYCQACPGGCRPLVGTEDGQAIHAWRGSTADQSRHLPGHIRARSCRRAHSSARRRRVGGPHRRWPLPALRAVLAGAATVPWRLARCCPFLQFSCIHAWRGSTTGHVRQHCVPTKVGTYPDHAMCADQGRHLPGSCDAYRRCVPSSRLACGNWKALLAS